MAKKRSVGSGGNRKGNRQRFGNIRQLNSGRFQARFTGPDGVTYRGPLTFETLEDARTWLGGMKADIKRASVAGVDWTPPGQRAIKKPGLKFGEYADEWLRTRKVKGHELSPRTRAHYRKLLDNFILPTFKHAPIRQIDHDAVDDWYDLVAPNAPTYRAHAYSLLRTILGTAVDRGIISTANPAKVRGGGSTTRVKKIEVPTDAELAVIVNEIPDKYKLMVLLGYWTHLRFGELVALRRQHIDLRRGVVKVRQGVVRVAGEVIVKDPKSDAGSRDVDIPPHVMDAVRRHLDDFAEPGKDGLLFPAANGGYLAPSSFYRVYYPAREKAGRSDLRFHDLRHGGLTRAAGIAGVSLAELMARAGQSTQGAAMRYQHAAKERGRQIAAALSEGAE